MLRAASAPGPGSAACSGALGARIGNVFFGKHFREAFGADRFIHLKGKNLTHRSGQGADFVETLADGTEKHWDLKGPFPGEFIDQQLPNILDGFDEHYEIHFANKDEFLVVDLAGLKPSAKERIIDHLRNLDLDEELFEILDDL